MLLKRTAYLTFLETARHDKSYTLYFTFRNIAKICEILPHAMARKIIIKELYLVAVSLLQMT